MNDVISGSNDMGTRRMVWIDQLRGFAILTVVISHVFTFCFGRENPSVVANYFISFYMPLFFFISGFVGYKKEVKVSLGREVMNKARQLLLPTLVFFVLYEWLVADNWMADLMHRSKGGYWFLIGLFYISCLYSVLRRIFLRMKLGEGVQDVCLVTMGVALLVLPLVNSIVLGNGDTDLLSYTKLSFFLYYVLGLISRRKMGVLFGCLSNGWAMGGIMVMGVIGFMVMGKYDLEHGVIGLMVPPVLSVASVMLFLQVFRQYEEDFIRRTPFLSNVGQRTLDIYVIHWLVLPRGLDMVGRFFATTDAHVLYFAVGAVAALLVALVSYGIGSVIRLSPELAQWVLGARMVKKEK